MEKYIKTKCVGCPNRESCFNPLEFETRFDCIKYHHNLTDDEAILWSIAQDNTDINSNTPEIGYRAIADLQISLESRKAETWCFADLTADFSWDGKLITKVQRIIKEIKGE